MVAMELPRLRAARCVAVYAALPDEPDTALLRAELRARRVRVLLPVIRDATTLTWAVDDGRLVPDTQYGVPQPAGERLSPEAIAEAEVVIAPALAVDTLGTRLGRGRGYYDRALRLVAPDAMALAVVHDEEVLDARTTPIPRQAHDAVMDGVLTPSRWMYFSPNQG
jgi:5-formyltetrahydrofolate cyclo-ligase